MSEMVNVIAAAIVADQDWDLPYATALRMARRVLTAATAISPSVADDLGAEAAKDEFRSADLAHASEGDTDLHGDTDARHWAELFASVFEVRRLADIGNRGIFEPVDTEGLMLTWFARAIEISRMGTRQTEG